MITDREATTADSIPIKEMKRYKKGTLHDARIVQFNLIDGLAIISLQKSVLDKPYIRYSDINVGDVVEGIVERAGSLGLVVSITEGIRGLCSRMQVSDLKTITAKPDKKHKPGSKVKCRVINVDPLRKRLLLTCKKSFLRCPEDALLVDYSAAKPGDCYSGVITSVHPYGVIVHFFGSVKGIVRKSELSATRNITDPSLEFWVGQPVKCRVMECEPSTQRMLLSLRVDPDADKNELTSAETALTPGTFVEGKVTGIASNGITLKYPPTGEVLFLPHLHLSDYTHLCTLHLALHQTKFDRSLREGAAAHVVVVVVIVYLFVCGSGKPYVLSDLLVVCGKLKFKPALVTRKKLMLDHMKQKGYATTIVDLKVWYSSVGLTLDL